MAEDHAGAAQVHRRQADSPGGPAAAGTAAPGPGRAPGNEPAVTAGAGAAGAGAAGAGAGAAAAAAAGAATRPDRNPGELVAAGVEACLSLARTWHAWDGRPIARTMDGEPNTWTPHKALRRIADHLTDHLHEVEALLAGAEPVPDEWHGRRVTLAADWASFTELDYQEACSRLRRLGRWYVLRYQSAGPESWDAPRRGAWTLRAIAEHVAGVSYYAEQVGALC